MFRNSPHFQTGWAKKAREKKMGNAWEKKGMNQLQKDVCKRKEGRKEGRKLGKGEDGAAPEEKDMKNASYWGGRGN